MMPATEPCELCAQIGDARDISVASQNTNTLHFLITFRHDKSTENNTLNTVTCDLTCDQERLTAC